MGQSLLCGGALYHHHHCRFIDQFKDIKSATISKSSRLFVGVVRDIYLQVGFVGKPIVVCLHYLW